MLTREPESPFQQRVSVCIDNSTFCSYLISAPQMFFLHGLMFGLCCFSISSDFLSYFHLFISSFFFVMHEFSDSSAISAKIVSGKKNRTFQNSISQAKLNVMSCDVDMSIMVTTTAQSVELCFYCV